MATFYFGKCKKMKEEEKEKENMGEPSNQG